MIEIKIRRDKSKLGFMFERYTSQPETRKFYKTINVLSLIVLKEMVQIIGIENFKFTRSNRLENRLNDLEFEKAKSLLLS